VSNPDPKARRERLTITNIRTDGGTQPRERLYKVAVAEYAEAIRNGAVLPPVVVFGDGSAYWLADGFHRLEAARLAGQPDIAAEVHAGSQRDAILFSVGANAQHGLRRTNADKRRAVLKLLEDGEWSKFTDREIARRCGVSQPFVSGLRREFQGESDNGYHLLPPPGQYTELYLVDPDDEHGGRFAMIRNSYSPGFYYLSVFDRAGGFVEGTTKPIKGEYMVEGLGDVGVRHSLANWGFGEDCPGRNAPHEGEPWRFNQDLFDSLEEHLAISVRGGRTR
jgi:hypothetical protein